MCPNDGMQTKTGHWMCEECEHDYRRKLAALRGLMFDLTNVAYKLVHVGQREHAPNTSVAPLPINEAAWTLRGEAVEWLQTTVNRLDTRYVNASWRWSWDMLMSTDTVLTLPDAPADYMALADLTRRIERFLTPRDAMIVIGQCPDCHRQAEAPEDATVWTCPDCGETFDVQVITSARNRKLWRLDYTGSPAQCARYLNGLGIKVRGKRISVWLTRSKLTHAEPIGTKGQYRFNLGELAALAGLDKQCA